MVLAAAVLEGSKQTWDLVQGRGMLERTTLYFLARKGVCLLLLIVSSFFHLYPNMLRLITRTRSRTCQSHSRIVISRTFFSTPPPPPITPLLDLASTSLPSIEPSFLPLLLAALLFSRDEEESQGSDLHKPPWIVQDQTSSGRGLGVVASRGLARGELLIAERPLCCWPQGLTAAQAQTLFEEMGEKERSVYLTLARPEGLVVGGEGEVLGIRATNGFAVQLPISDGENGAKVVSMVFPRISRLNHSWYVLRFE